MSARSSSPGRWLGDRLWDAGAVVALSVCMYVAVVLWSQAPSKVAAIDSRIVYQTSQVRAAPPAAPAAGAGRAAATAVGTAAATSVAARATPPPQRWRGHAGVAEGDRPAPAPPDLPDPELDALLAGGQACPANFAGAVAKQLAPWADTGIQMGMLDHLYCIRKQVARVSIHGGRIRQVNWQLNMDHNRLRSSFWLLRQTIDRAQQRGVCPRAARAPIPRARVPPPGDPPTPTPTPPSLSHTHTHTHTHTHMSTCVRVHAHMASPMKKARLGVFGSLQAARSRTWR